jgi:hypothetical protein
MVHTDIDGKIIRLRRNLYVLLCVTAITLYLFAIFKYSFNAPYGDDYDAILYFLNQFSVQNFEDKFSLVLSQHNEHRIVLDRLFAIFSWKIFGQVNFTHLIWMGNLGWFLVIWLFWKWAKSKQVTFIEFVPVIICLLTFCHHELMTWAMASIQQYYQILFVICSLFLLTSNHTYWALFFYVLATYTGGGGIILGPMIILYYLTSKNFRNASIALAIVALVTALYFYWPQYITNPQSPGSIKILFRPDLSLEFILGFLGSAGNIPKIGLPSGIVFGSLLCLLWANKYSFNKKHNPFLWWTFIYIILVAILTAITRGGFGVLYAQTTSRYTQYSLLIMAITYLSYLLGVSNPKKRNTIFWIGLSFSLILFTYWYPRGNVAIKSRYLDLSAGKISYPNAIHPQEILQKSKELKIFGETN